MFREFNEEKMSKWNGLSLVQQRELLDDEEVELAVTLEIKIEKCGRTIEEHKYYQVTNHTKLLNEFTITDIKEEETVISLKTSNEKNNYELISLKPNEEKIIKLGISPYTFFYKIKITDIKYGKVFSL